MEVLASSALLPACIGGPEGEPVLEDRRIRIAGRIGRASSIRPSASRASSPQFFAQFSEVKDTPEEQRGSRRKGTDPAALDTYGDFVTEVWNAIFKPDHAM